MNDIAVAFRDADGPLQPDLVHCLDFMNGLDFFRAYKSHSWKSLNIRPAARILDVGCGVGFDVVEMARAHPGARFVGVDRSRRFLGLARARAASLANAEFAAGDAARLPFADNSFEGARIDRSLQHMADPAEPIREMVRVTRPGGRVVAAEPDWGTFFLFNGENDVSGRMAAKWLQSIARPHIGREIGALFADSGLTALGAAAHALALTRLGDADVVFDLPRLARNCVADGVLTESEADAWRAAAVQASAAGTFLACLTIVERWGIVAA